MTDSAQQMAAALTPQTSKAPKTRWERLREYVAETSIGIDPEQHEEYAEEMDEQANQACDEMGVDSDDIPPVVYVNEGEFSGPTEIDDEYVERAVRDTEITQTTIETHPDGGFVFNTDTEIVNLDTGNQQCLKIRMQLMPPVWG